MQKILHASHIVYFEKMLLPLKDVGKCEQEIPVWGECLGVCGDYCSPVHPQLPDWDCQSSLQNTRKDVSKRSCRYACGSCAGRKCHLGTHAHWGAPQSYNLHGTLFSYTATIINIVVSQAIVHANFHPCGNFGHATVFFPQSMHIYLRSQCLFWYLLWSSCIQLFRSVSDCPYGKEGLVGDKICNIPWLMNQLATVERVRTMTGRKQCLFVISEDLPHFLEVLHCFGVFRTISDIVFKADFLPTDDVFKQQVSCTSPTLSISVAAAELIGYRIRVLEAISAAVNNEPGLWD